MAWEIINDGPTHPQRVEALLYFLRFHGEPITKQELGNFLMPSVAEDDRDIFENVLESTKKLKLLENKSGKISPSNSVTNTSNKKEIRTLIIDSVLSAQKEEDDNFLLAQYYAWLISKFGIDERVDANATSLEKLAGQFNSEINLKTKARAFNETKGRNFQYWATYVGLGHLTAGAFVPFPFDRISQILPSIFSKKKGLQIDSFLRELSKIFPFLDGGKIYKSIPVLTGSDATLSPCLSATLRALHDSKILELEGTIDAPKHVKLHPNPSHEIRSGVVKIKFLEPVP